PGVGRRTAERASARRIPVRTDGLGASHPRLGAAAPRRKIFARASWGQALADRGDHMNRVRIGSAITLTVLIVAAASLHADVRSEQKSHVEFAGMFGKVVNLFGGKAAKEGIVSTHALKGRRLATLSESGGQIIDLNEEKIYTVDSKRKSYTVMTFAELRRQMEEARKKAADDLRKEQERAAKEKKDAPPPRQNETEL